MTVAVNGKPAIDVAGTLSGQVAYLLGVGVTDGTSGEAEAHFDNLSVHAR